jgi:hypothetical protein
MIVGHKKVKPQDLKPAEYNPRHIDEPALAGLIESIRQFGIVQPFVRNVRTGNLVGGHQRLKAVLSLDEQFMAGEKKLGRRFKIVDVIDVDLSEEEEKALNVTLNSLKISGRFTDSINDILDELKQKMGEEYLMSMRLDELYIDMAAWHSNMESLAKVGDYDDKEAMDTLVIDVPMHLKDKVRDFLRDHFETEGFEGVSVR